jgi:hypothetical protein
MFGPAVSVTWFLSAAASREDRRRFASLPGGNRIRIVYR